MNKKKILIEHTYLVYILVILTLYALYKVTQKMEVVPKISGARMEMEPKESVAEKACLYLQLTRPMQLKCFEYGGIPP